MLSKSRAQSHLCMLGVSDLKDTVDTVNPIQAVYFFVIDCFFDGGIVKVPFKRFEEFVLEEHKASSKSWGLAWFHGRDSPL